MVSGASDQYGFIRTWSPTFRVDALRCSSQCFDSEWQLSLQLWVSNKQNLLYWFVWLVTDHCLCDVWLISVWHVLRLIICVTCVTCYSWLVWFMWLYDVCLTWQVCDTLLMTCDSYMTCYAWLVTHCLCDFWLLISLELIMTCVTGDSIYLRDSCLQTVHLIGCFRLMCNNLQSLLWFKLSLVGFLHS